MLALIITQVFMYFKRFIIHVQERERPYWLDFILTSF